MKRFVLPALLVGWLVVSLLAPPLLVAQTTGVTLKVMAGLNGFTPMNTWFPVTVTLSNAGNDVQGEVVWRWEGATISFAQAVDLPRGAEKQIVLPVRNTFWGRSASVAFVAGGKPLASRAVTLTPHDAQQGLAVVSDEGLALPELGTALLGLQLTLTQLKPEQLPDRAEFLNGLAVIILTDDTAGLRSEQRAALAGWVVRGGRLVLSGATARTAAGLPELAAATVGATAPQSLTLTTLRPVIRGDSGATAQVLPLDSGERRGAQWAAGRCGVRPAALWPGPGSPAEL